MKNVLIIVQVGPYSQYGKISAADADADGQPQLHWLLERLKQSYDSKRIIVEGPSYEAKGTIGRVVAAAGVVGYFRDVDPLERLVGITQYISDDGFLMLVDGSNCSIAVETWPMIVDWAIRRKADLIAFDDDFPPAFAFKLVRAEALLRSAEKIVADRLLAHAPFPCVYIAHEAEQFNCIRLANAASFLPSFDDPYYRYYEKARASVGEGPPQRRDWFYDSHRFVYELALEYIKPGGRVVDMSCAKSLYCDILAEKAGSITESTGKDSWPELENASFDNAICIMDENIGSSQVFQVAKRVLRPNGRLIFSSPQAPQENIDPTYLEPGSIRLADLRQAAEHCFQHATYEAIKIGRISYPGEATGARNFAIFR